VSASLCAPPPQVFRPANVLACLLAFGMPSLAASDHVRQLNRIPQADPKAITAIVGARLIDGGGGEPLTDSAVVVWGERIVAAGARASVSIPGEAVRVDGTGLTLLPGLFDAHLHLGRGRTELPNAFVSRGVTSARDPGAWIEVLDPLLDTETPLPRLFLTGPHLDTAPPAYPENSIMINGPEEGRRWVNRFADQGASAIKVYFRLPLDTIRAVCDSAHERGIPVTAHLELVRADDAIRAGLDGIEHVTSVGTVLAGPREAEKFRQAVTAENSARQDGRYELWSQVDLAAPKVRQFIDLMVVKGTFLSPNLAVFERQPGDRNTTQMHVEGFRNMMRFVGMAAQAGARVVVGSHSNVPHAERGWAYHREMELMVEAGMTPMHALVGATLDNARFFYVDERLGSIEPGKLADLVLVEGNPLEDIKNMRHVRGVMQNGVWIVDPR
jgi:imidazolonepropionase-like amidohydrolase